MRSGGAANSTANSTWVTTGRSVLILRSVTVWRSGSCRSSGILSFLGYGVGVRLRTGLRVEVWCRHRLGRAAAQIEYRVSSDAATLAGFPMLRDTEEPMATVSSGTVEARTVLKPESSEGGLQVLEVSWSELSIGQG